MENRIRLKKTWLFIAFLSSFIFMLSAAGSSDPHRVQLLQQAISRYAEIEKNGGWEKVTLSKKQYKLGDAGLAVKQLKKRLKATGDYQSSDMSEAFTIDLDMAVRKAQRRFGFQQNGIIDAEFVRVLNVPVQQRLQQLQVNLQRLITNPLLTASKKIVVNIPEYKLYVYEDETPVLQMNVVVGAPKTKTAIFNDELTHIVFSPYWNVPSSIVKNEILPKMRRSSSYLSRNGYEVVGQEGGLPKIRQKPGVGNSLGMVKFLFPNEHDIYFHDTPLKTLFNKQKRAYSHGCIRLSEPEKLAEYLLKEDPKWNSFTISEAMYAGEEQWVKLKTPIPVQMTYFTAWIDAKGELQFRDDVYGYDKEASNTVAESSREKYALLRKK